jgi:hypothetical protein
MRARALLIGLLSGLALAAGVTAYAVEGGGFPSSPIFQSLGIKQSPSSYPWGANTPHISMTPTIAIASPAANGSEELIANCYYNGTAWVYMTTGACSVLSVNPTSTVYFTAPSGTAGALANLTPIWRPTYGRLNASSGGCPIDATYDNQNIASCSRIGAGEYVVSFVAAFSDLPLCTVSYSLPSAPVSQNILTVSAANASIQVDEINSSGTVSDYGPFAISCQ